jgi:hypothetical protein
MFMAAACGKSTPQCSDDDVKKLVIQISHDELKKQLTTQSIITVAHVNPAIWGNPSYDDLKKNMEGREDIQAVISAVDKQMAGVSLQLEGIRSRGIDKAIKKCECEASLLFSNGKSIPVTYYAQYTDDKMVYVEVSGLE